MGSTTNFKQVIRSKRRERPRHYLELKENVHKQKVMAFEQGGDGVLRYQGSLCVPMVDD